ncbi:MAG: Flp family type IVb pilin [Isosphaeraceae bacterium]|nr:Flp family type IVb pilin [Isosphaeraceae bacterium]
MNDDVAKMQQFLVAEDGPTAVEYAMLIALIIVVCVTAVQALGQDMSRTFDRVWDAIRHG